MPRRAGVFIRFVKMDIMLSNPYAGGDKPRMKMGTPTDFLEEEIGCSD